MVKAQSCNLCIRRFDSDLNLHMLAVAEIGDALDCGSSVERRAGASPVGQPFGFIAQSVEQKTEDLRVGRSIRSGTTLLGIS